MNIAQYQLEMNLIRDSLSATLCILIRKTRKNHCEVELFGNCKKCFLKFKTDKELCNLIKQIYKNIKRGQIKLKEGKE